MSVHPITVMWETENRPPPYGKDRRIVEPKGGRGVCGITGEYHDETWRLRDVVSNLYTSHEEHRTPLLGPSAAWALKCPQLRYYPASTWTGHVGHAGQLLRRLCEGRLVGSESCTIIDSRQKHLASRMKPRTVVSDHGPLLWTDREAELLRLFDLVRWKHVLKEPQCRDSKLWPYSVRNSPDPGGLIEAWEMLEPWRADPRYMAVAIQITRRPEEPPPERPEIPEPKQPSDKKKEPLSCPQTSLF